MIGQDSRAKYVLAAEHDTIFPLATIRAVTADWTATTHGVIAGADHFLAGHETEVATRCATWLASAVRP